MRNHGIVLVFLCCVLLLVRAQQENYVCSESPESIPMTWCSVNNPFTAPMLFSEVQFPNVTHKYICSNFSKNAECKNVIYISSSETLDKNDRTVIVALVTGTIVKMDFNTYKVMSIVKLFDRFDRFAVLNNSFYAAESDDTVTLIRNNNEIYKSFSNFDPTYFSFLKVQDKSFLVIQAKKTALEHQILFINVDTLQETRYTVLLTPQDSSFIYNIKTQFGNWTQTVSSLRVVRTVAAQRTLIAIATEKRVKIIVFTEENQVIDFGEGNNVLSTFYTLPLDSSQSITGATLFTEDFARPSLNSNCSVITTVYPSMNVNMALTIHDPITKTSFVIVKHLPEIAYYNFSTSVPSQNPANRPVPYPCKGNDYLISGTCKNSNEYTIPLKAKPLTIKERFIDIPEINGKQKPYTNFNTINVPLFCESLRVSSEQMYLDCMSQLKCEVSLMKSSMSKYSMLFTNFLYSALFLVDETNVVTIIAVQPNYNSESELFVKVINEIKMIGTIQYLYISPNGQHMITPISRRKWELDSIERQVKVCAALDANPNNQFLKPFEEACDSMPQFELDLNHFAQYTSCCIPGQYCQSLSESVLEIVAHGYYSPRPNLNLTCPIGSFCKFGIKTQCPPGYYCDKPVMADPTRCSPQLETSSCYGYGNTSPKKCPSGTKCIAPYFPPLPSPPGYYIDDNYELQTCTVGQYCNLGRSANSVTIDKLNCPALTYCPDPSIIEPTLCSCNSSYCSYCTNGSFVEIPCPKGYYCRVDVLNKQPLKIACKPGYYCPENSIYQQICPPRYYCPTPGEIYECPERHYCRSGTTVPSKCTILSFCGKGVEADQVNFLGVALIIVVVILVLVIYRLICFGKNLYYKVERRIKLNKVSNKRNSLLEAKDKDHIVMSSRSIAAKDAYLMDIKCEGLGLVVNGSKAVLNNVSASFKRGTLTAIMGPSGCGKSSFITTLADLAFYGKRSGKVFVNGIETSLTRYSDLVGFVPQEDIMIRTMTVYETLFFSARTRLSWRKSLGEIKSIVNRVIKILGLEDIKNSIIGDEKQRGISGGQRKRVNIGMELVAQPSLLLLDEPTSGLDSSASQEVCSALRKIANCGITVLTVIHQPRFEIFNLFDNVLFLAKGGFTVYFGPTERVQTYFEKLGFELPNSVNPPDFYLDIISGTEKSKFGEMVNLIDAWQNHVLLQEEQEQVAKAEFVVVESHDATENNNDIQGTMNLASIHQQDEKPIIENNYYNTVNKTKYIPRATSPIVQFFFAFIRTLIQQGRDWTSFIIDNGLIFVGGIFLSISVFGERFEGALDTELCTGMPEQLRFTCNVPLNDIALKIASLLPPIMIMSGVMASIGTFSNERVVYIRESMSGLNTFSYFLAKNVSNIPNIIVAPFVFLCVFQFFAAPRASFFMYYWALMLLSFVAYGIGYLLSMVFRQTLAYIAGVVLVLSSTQFGGVSPLLRTLLNSPFYPTRAMPYMSVVRWATELIYLIEIQEYHNMKIYNIDRALEFYMFSFDNMWKTSVILLSWGIATRILAFVLLQQSKPNSISNLIVYFVRAKWYKLTKWIETGLYNYKLRIVEKMKMQSVVDVDDHIHFDEED